jgi:hypothetical protein
MPLILLFRKLRQEDCEFTARLGYRVIPCLKKKKKKVCKVVMSLKHKQNIIAIILHQLHATVSSVEEVN